MNYNCIWCTSKINKIESNSISKYKNDKFSFVYCPNCGIKFSVPMETKSVNYDLIQKNHVGYSFHNADNEWIKSILSGPNKKDAIFFATQYLINNSVDYRYADILKTSYQAFLDGKKLKILEVGCNLGYLGAVLLSQGHEYLGVDIQKNSIKKAIKYYGNHFKSISIEQFAKNKLNKRKYDIVCSFEVIEHVAEPLKFLKTTANCLNKNGKIIFSTPDGSFIPNKKWYSDLPPIHLSLFKRRTFKYLRSQGFKVDFLNSNHFISSPHRTALLFNSLFQKDSNHLPDLYPRSKNFHYSGFGKKKKIFRSFLIDRLALIIKLLYAQIAHLLNLPPPGGSIVVQISK